MESFSFGDSSKVADSLLDAVLKGRKTATSWAAIHGSQNSKVGGRQIIKDSRGKPKVVIEITELARKPFNQVDEMFARDEGEGDLSLDYWRKEHERYFTQEGTFVPDMEVYCERFKVVLALEPITHDDLDAYLDLDKKVESRTYVAVQNRAEAEEEFAKGPMYFIKQDGKVAGAVSYSIQEDGSAYINGLAVSPESQGQGLGRATLELILKELRNVPKIWLVTHPENERAIALYQSFGFTITDRIENFHGDDEPRIVLTYDNEDSNSAPVDQLV